MAKPPTPARSRTDQAHQLLSGARKGRGWINPHGKGWKQVAYSVRDGQAVLEGCISLGPVDRVRAAARFRDEQDALEGVVISNPDQRWPNRTIPYVMPATFPDKQRVLDAIAHWHAKTSIRFIPRTNQPDYLVFVSTRSGCLSEVGRVKGPQEVRLSAKCDRGKIIHELGHAVGLWHEHSREDRDQVIEVVHANLIPGTELNFDQQIVNGNDVGSYDLASIMHYPLNAFSANGQPTIRVKPGVAVPPGVTIGQRDGLSAGDIAAVETLYQGVPKPV